MVWVYASGMTWSAVTCSRSMISRAVPASQRSMTTTLEPAASGPPSVMVKPPDQKYGKRLISLSSGVSPSALAHRQLCTTGVLFLWRTAFGLALVPEVRSEEHTSEL